ncbi:hypothetical protein ACFOW1_01350 [Parasediminibacterium paludis]|uniref:Uncharacterized protein n=1 Tax=Parasediminibacterium paludis TaxID=908966 RepID=A0ABV8PR88_9BACT
MSWNERIQNVYQILRENNRSYVIDDMITEFGIGGTVGEQFSIICTWLARLRNQNAEVYQLFRHDADEILKEGIALKYFTESDYKRQ